jgi:hypothetical protein
MISKIDIINMGLSYISQQNITAINENSISAKAVNLHYEQALRTVLSEYSWRFATVLEEMPSIPVEKIENADDAVALINSEYKYRTPFINDTIKLLEVRGPDRRLLNTVKLPRVGISTRYVREYEKPYEIRGNHIYSNFNQLYLKAVVYIDNPAIYPPEFVNCLTYELAERLTKILLDSASYRETMRQLHKMSLAKAIAADQMAAPTEYINF